MKWNPDTEFEINRYVFASKKILKPVTLSVIADLHNCFYGRNNDRLYEAVLNERPDAVIIAGDLIEAGIRAEETEGLKLLYRLSKKLPVYYGVGNHEKKLFLTDKYLRQRDELTAGLKKCGVKLISNKSYSFKDTGVVITGLDIPHEYYRRIVHKKITAGQLYALMGRPDRAYYNVLIAHDPSHFDAYAAYGPDLVLSGHVHGGIIRLPLLGGVLSPEYKLFPKYDAGIYEKKKTKMLLSRGLGSHTVNLRINNKPELITVRLENGDY